jgi:hypothetical protein
MGLVRMIVGFELAAANVSLGCEGRLSYHNIPQKLNTAVIHLYNLYDKPESI